MSTPFVDARAAALEVLHYTARGPRGPLPRTAGWGYAEPYTRDWMIAAPGILSTGDPELIAVIRRMLLALAAAQSPHGQIPGLADAPGDLGSSDTTPLFLIGLAMYRKVSGEADLLVDAAARAWTWLTYQIPDGRYMVAQQPTADWRDEQWVLGHGLYVNALVHLAHRLYGAEEAAAGLRAQLDRPMHIEGQDNPPEAGGLAVPGAPYFGLWAYKVWGSTRFDLLGNSLAILSGLVDRERARTIVAWVEETCARLRAAGLLVGDLPPCLVPYIMPTEPDWHPRYARFNRPGEYHNGGIWPFVCGFYIAALVATGLPDLAAQKLTALTALVRPARSHPVAFGFNEWICAQDGRPCGEDWQVWSAALYLYAGAAVAAGRAPFVPGPAPGG
jgi:hypothetical protein